MKPPNRLVLFLRRSSIWLVRNIRLTKNFIRNSWTNSIRNSRKILLRVQS
ncbi:hypothetical protein AHF37_11216 [Paragonimus kellicotti]|nr:hypothetical protein AHF37_11216 [Paragonimus kellicotti]